MSSTVLVLQPFSANSEYAYRNVIKPSILAAGASPLRADQVPIHGAAISAIQQAISSADLILADVSVPEANLMYEIGYANALRKPLVLVAISGTSVPFDLLETQTYTYAANALAAQGSVNELSRIVAEALRTPARYVQGSAETERMARRRIFISYAHQDREYLDRLLVHLRPLEREGLLEIWADTALRGGDRWKKEIETALARANAAVLLISADFLASEFITKNELPPLLASAEQKGTKILPVVIKPCRYTRDKNLRDFQAVNDPANPLIQLATGEQEAVYDKVAAELEHLVGGG